MSNPREKKQQNQKNKPQNYPSFDAKAEITKPAQQLETTPEKADVKDVSNLKWHLKFKSSENCYPQNLTWAYRNAPTHRAIVNGIVAMCKGDGLKLKNLSGDPIEYDDLNEADKSFFDRPSGRPMYNLNKLFQTMLLQYKIQGELWMRWKSATTGDTTRWTVSNTDGSKARLSKTDGDVILSSVWHLIKLGNGFGKMFTEGINKNTETLSLWGMEGEAEKGSEFMTFMRREEPEHDYYGVPDYLACLKACFIEYMSDSYNQSRLENGYFPDVFVTLVGDPPEGMSRGDWMKDEYERMKGGLNAGKPRIQNVSDKELMPEIQVVDSAKDGEFLNAKEDAFNSIVRAHRFFPKLAGISVAGELGGNRELMNMWKIVMKTVAIPDVQAPVLEMLNEVLRVIGAEFRAYVDNSAPIGVEDQIKADEELTQDEKRGLIGYDPLTTEGVAEADQIGGLTNKQIEIKYNLKKTASNGNN